MKLKVNDVLQQGYIYKGRHRGFYLFEDEDGKLELFSRSESHAGWHLTHGKYVYEFCSSKID
jgi:hypothetical protein